MKDDHLGALAQLGARLHGMGRPRVRVSYAPLQEDEINENSGSLIAKSIV